MPGFDITENPTFDLRGLGAAASYVPTGRAWDCSIGGLPFLLATSQQVPFHRQTADWRRSRYDSGTDYGEQSLDTGYWARNQLSFHYGAGQVYAEALEDNPSITRFRFNTGGNIDPWTAGSVVPTKSWSASPAVTTGSNPLLMSDDNAHVLIANGTSLSWTSGTGTNAVTWGGAGSILALTQDGTNYYAADATGIYKGTLHNGAGALIWNTGNASVAMRFVKSRLMAGIGPSVYELVSGGPALPTALFTHPNTSWKWTAFAEGPNAIYASGYAGAVSAIFRISVTTSGSTVTLGAPIVVAELPRNEVVYTIYSYLGTFLGVGTSSGLRIAEINTDGSLTLSPVQFSVTGGVRDIVGVGSFLYVTGGSNTPVGDGTTAPGLYRVNLGVPTDAGLYAWSPEATLTGAAGGTAWSVVLDSTGAMYLSVSGITSNGVQIRSLTSYSDGWVVLPLIRMGTGENKVFRDIQVRGVVPAGARIEVYASSTGSGAPSSWSLAGSLGNASDGFLSLASAAAGPQEVLYLAFKLVSNGTTAPTLFGYRLRTVPTVKRTRLLDVPLMCFDTETDRLGSKLGVQGGAWTRLSALEALEDSGQIILWQDFTSGESRQATIEKVTAIRTTPPERSYKNAGWILSVSLRLL